MKLFSDDIEKEFERMRLRMEKMFGSLSPPGVTTFQSATGWRPPLDLSETSNEFIILVDLAGTQPKDVEVVVDKDVVRFSGNRSRPSEQKVIRVHHMEIDFGPFSHAVRLPGPVNPDGAGSTYRDGFLTIRLPKQVRASGEVKVTANE
ncbi:MAG: Hsp20/alpha crystallin family protein [Deltaproteobacteria bacterium]|nr:MAG: Hsp20/alpha crystallin family protein [Deltaproteobacteria bacterium]